MFDETQLIYEDEITEEMDLTEVCEGYMESVDIPDTIPTETLVNPGEVKAERNPFVLGKIRGPIFGEVGVINGNGRIYVPEILDAILTSPYVNQMMSNKCLLGECHHPTDKRGTIFMEEACVSWVKFWKEGDMLYGEADILDTDRGRLLWTLAKYGSKIGVSARAGGKGIKGVYRGVRADIIKPENYEIKTFDCVLNPGFAKARPTIITEDEGSVQCNVPEEFFSEMKSLIEEGKIDVNFARSYIDYCEDDSLKSLLPMLEESTTGDIDDTSSVELVKELSEENTRLNELIDALREEAVRNVPSLDESVVSDLMSMVEERNSKISSLTEENSKNNKDLELMLNDALIGKANGIQLYDELCIKYEEALKEIAALTSDLEVMVNENEELRTKLDGKVCECSDLYFENEDLKKRVESLTEEASVKEASLCEEDSGFPIDFLYEEVEEKKNPIPDIKICNKIDMSGSILSVVNDEVINEENTSRRNLIQSIKGGF